MSRFRHLYALFTIFCAYILIVLGALQTSKAGAVFVIGHRHIGTTVAVLTAILAGVLWSGGTSLRAIGVGTLTLSVVQTWLGMAHTLPILHAWLSQIFFGLLVIAAILTSEAWRTDSPMVEDSGTPSLGALSTVLPLMILVQIGFGAALRHGAWSGIPHILGAVLVMATSLILCIFTLSQHSDHTILRQSSLALLVATLAQVFLGVGAYVARTPGGVDAPWLVVALTAGHVSLGTLAMSASLVLALQVSKNVRKVRIVRVSSRGIAATS